MASSLGWIIQLKESVIGWVTRRSPSQPPDEQKLRSGEIVWRAQHSEELRKLSGEWVALEGDCVIAHDSDVAKVIRSARSRGIAVPYIFYVDDTPSHVFKIGI